MEETRTEETKVVETGKADGASTGGDSVLDKIKEMLGMTSKTSQTEEETESKEKETTKNGASEETKNEKSFTQEDLDAAKEAARQELLDEQKEAERLKKLSPEEQANEALKKANDKTAQLERKLELMELEKKAGELLKEHELPSELSGILNYENEEKLMASVETVGKVYKTALEAGVNEKLRGKTPKGLGASGNLAENLVESEIAKRIRGGF